MSTIKVNRAQLGQSATATQNFTLTAEAADGTIKLARGNAGATTQDIMTIASNGEVDFPQMARSLSANGYQKLPSGLIIQWGTVSQTGSTPANVTFPTGFPVACFVVAGSNSTGSGTQTSSFYNVSKTGFTTVQMYINGVATGTTTVSWLAIGY